MSVNEAIEWLQDRDKVSGLNYPSQAGEIAAILREAKEIIEHCVDESNGQMSEPMMKRAERWLKE